MDWYNVCMYSVGVYVCEYVDVKNRAPPNDETNLLCEWAHLITNTYSDATQYLK